MAGGEKKGLFSRLFKRAEEPETPRQEERDKKSALTAVEGQTEEKATVYPPGVLDAPTAVPVLEKVDAVELELDIPEHEISTVALSVKDLESLSPDDRGSAPPLDLIPEDTTLQGTELETIEGPADIRSLAYAFEQTEEPAPTVTEMVASDTYAMEPLLRPDEHKGTPQDVDSGPGYRDEDENDIELDLENDLDESRPQKEVPAVAEGTNEASIVAEQESSVASDQEAAAVTSGEVARAYGFPEFADSEKIEISAQQSAVALQEEIEREEQSEEEPSEPRPTELLCLPGAFADMPLERKDLDRLTPQMRTQAATLAEIVKTCQTPMRIAVRGAAGSGKTTLLRAVEALLPDTVIPIRLAADDYLRLGSHRAVPWLFLEGFVISLEEIASSNGNTDFAMLAAQMRDRLKLFAHADEWPKQEELTAPPARQGDEDPSAVALISLLKKELPTLVQTALNAGSAERICVMVDDADRLDSITAQELLEAMCRFLELESLVFLIVCDSEIVGNAVAPTYGSEMAADEALVRAERAFQLSVSVRSDYESAKHRLTGLLDIAGFRDAEHDVNDYVDLLTHSVGLYPRREKLVLNRLVAESRPRLETGSGLEPGNEDTVWRRKLLFGMICLDMAYPRVFQLLRNSSSNGKALGRLIDERLRDPGEVLILDQELALFADGVDRTESACELVAFVDVFTNILFRGDRNAVLDGASAQLLRQLAEFPVTAFRGMPMTRKIHDREVILSEFCRRVVVRVKQLCRNGAPDASDRKVRNVESGNPWFWLWFLRDPAKVVWGPGRAIYEVSFNKDNVVSVSLRCNAPKLVERGVARDILDGLGKLPLVKDGDFLFSQYDNGTIQIENVLLECSCGSAFDLVEEEIDVVAETLQALIDATSNLFDSSPREEVSGRQSVAMFQIPCKACGNPLEQIRLKDGSEAYRCDICRKLYKPKRPLKGGA
mgnify:CR=1 FL=1